MSPQENISLIRGYSKRVLTQVLPNDEKLTQSLVALMWTDARLARDFQDSAQGWAKDSAALLSVNPSDVIRIVHQNGAEEITKMVADNPVGAPPSRDGNFIKPSYASATWECATSACATSQCATSQCATASCPSYACPTWPR